MSSLLDEQTWTTFASDRSVFESSQRMVEYLCNVDFLRNTFVVGTDFAEPVRNRVGLVKGRRLSWM